MGGVGPVTHLVATALDFCDQTLDAVVRARRVDQRSQSLTWLLGGLGCDGFGNLLVRPSARLAVAPPDL